VDQDQVKNKKYKDDVVDLGFRKSCEWQLFRQKLTPIVSEESFAQRKK
jgi:hypothetical protein